MADQEKDVIIYPHYGTSGGGSVATANSNNTNNNDDVLKTPNVPSSSEDNSLIPPVNYTDPFVYHDGSQLGDVVAKPLNKQNAIGYDAEGNFGSNVGYDSIKVEGIYQPIIKYNNTVLDSSAIRRMELDYSDFYPKLNLEIDTGIATNIEFDDTPGMNNVITVIIIPAKDGAYKKISLNFKIYNHQKFGNIIYIDAEVSILPLEQQRCKHIHYTDHPPGQCGIGCQNVRGKVGSNGIGGEGTISCNPEHASKPNTWEYLHEIALQCGLGFASTDMCQNIQDRLPRLVMSTSYYNFIQNQLQFSGIDEDSIFDVWLDLYGCITMVNIPYVLTNDITYRHLSFKIFTGIRTTDSLMKDVEIQETHRTLSNFNKMSTKTNAEIKSYQWIVNNTDINSFGNLHTQYSFTPQGVQSGDNTISTAQVEVIENSIDGSHVEDYEISRCLETVVEVNDYNINDQKMIRDQFFVKLNSKLLEVELSYPNLGIQRGTLINLSIFDDDAIHKSKLMTSSDNVDGDTTTDMKNPSWTGNTKDVIQSEGEMVPNMEFSGLYYVHKMRFVYDSSSGSGDYDIKQYLYLFKKGPMTNIENKYTTPAVSDAGLGGKKETPEPSEPQIIPHY